MSQKRADNAKRIIAIILDCIFAFLIYIPFMLLGLIPFAGILFSLIGMVIYIGYMGLRDALPIADLGGASPGKKIMGIKAVQQDGSNCTYEISFKRNLPFVIPAALSLIPTLIPVIGVIIGAIFSVVSLVVMLVELYKVMTDEQGKRIGDIIANTMVVEVPKAAVPVATAPPAPAQPLPPVPTPEAPAAPEAPKPPTSES